jgi:hypothetical protein
MNPIVPCVLECLDSIQKTAFELDLLLRHADLKFAYTRHL